jgi:hypothetical protein
VNDFVGPLSDLVFTAWSFRRNLGGQFGGLEEMRLGTAFD